MEIIKSEGSQVIDKPFINKKKVVSKASLTRIMF